MLTNGEPLTMKRMLSLMLTVSLCSVSLLLNSQLVQAQTQEELQAQYTAELADYALTHTDAEVSAYADVLLNELTNENLDYGYAPQGMAGYDPGNYFLNAETWQGCWNREWEICRRQYNAALYQSAGISVGLGGACTLATAGTGLVLCLAGALGAHGFNIAAARNNRVACEMRGVDTCNQRVQPMR